MIFYELYLVHRIKRGRDGATKHDFNHKGSFLSLEITIAYRFYEITMFGLKRFQRKVIKSSR